MQRTDALLAHLFEVFTKVGDGAPSIDAKLQLLQDARQHCTGDNANKIDTFLLEKIAFLWSGLREAQANQAQIKVLLEQMLAPPFIPAVYLGPAHAGSGPGAMVAVGSAYRAIPLAKDIALESLQVGDEVLLNHELGLLVGKSSCRTHAFGETASFERLLDAGRMLIRWRDERLVVNTAAALRGQPLKNGDVVRFDPAVKLAYEKIDQSVAHQYLIEAVPDIRLDQVGGQRENLDKVVWALTLALSAPHKAKRYGLGGRCSILLVGPPGTGKTLIAKAALAEVARMSGCERAHICIVKPGEWEDPYVGVTQQKIRQTFDAMRNAGGFCALFLDELESIGRIRGGAVNFHSDKFCAALLAELQGFEERGNNIAVIAATNRKDLLDPALAERISDIEVQVGRPDMRAARAIFDVHLRDSLPFSPGSAGRSEIIHRAVARLYSPNSESGVSTLRFRDGSTRVVEPRELVSGRLIEQICRAARRSALRREVCNDQDDGLRMEDMDDAISDTIDRLSATLTKFNVHSYLSDLRQDLDVVAVDPPARSLPKPHRYLNVA